MLVHTPQFFLTWVGPRLDFHRGFTKCMDSSANIAAIDSKIINENCVAADSEIDNKNCVTTDLEIGDVNCVVADLEIDSDGGVVSGFASFFYWVFTHYHSKIYTQLDGKTCLFKIIIGYYIHTMLLQAIACKKRTPKALTRG